MSQQNALKEHVQLEETLVVDALSSIRGVIRENLERGFEHFLDKHKEDKSDGADKSSVLTLQPGAGNLGTPLNTTPDVLAGILMGEAPLKSAEIFYLTNMLEADGSITKLEKKEETGMTAKDAKNTETEALEAQTEEALKLSQDFEIETETETKAEDTARDVEDQDDVNDYTTDTDTVEALQEVDAFIKETLQAPQGFTAGSSFGGPTESTTDLASKETMAASAAAFSTLADMARQLATTQQQSVTTSRPVQATDVGNYTVDALMRELLRPMLKDWLDAHLPSLVKWLVTEQIEKMLNEQGGHPSGAAPRQPSETRETGVNTAA